MHGDPLEVIVRADEPATVVAIRGSVDSLTAEHLLAAFESTLAEGRTRLIADLGGAVYLSSAGLRVLLSAAKDSRKRGGDVRIAAAAPAVLKVLELSGFTSILKVFADVDAAVASYRV